MGIAAHIETREDALARTSAPELASKAIATFINCLWVFCEGSGQGTDLGKVIAWFDRLELGDKQDICLMRRAAYGPWDYRAHEYGRYLRDASSAEMRAQEGLPDWLKGRRGALEYASKVAVGAGSPMSEEEFDAISRAIEDKWTDANDLLRSVQRLVEVLLRKGPEEVWFYTEADTLKDLVAMVEILTTLVRNGEEVVRIRMA